MEIFDDLKDCRLCDLHSTRTNIVFGRGNPESNILIIGEAPGYYEDLSGRPFVGKAGKLLDALLRRANMDPEDDVYIANILKCLH